MKATVIAIGKCKKNSPEQALIDEYIKRSSWDIVIKEADNSNQESEAFPSGLCAERSVLFYAFSKYPGVAVEALAIAARKGRKLTATPTRPCGACIQVMLDAQKRGGKPIKVILGAAEKIEVISSINDLIPFSFDNL